MRKIGFVLLLSVYLIAMANNMARADENEELTFKKAVNEFAKNLTELRKYMIAESERRHQEEEDIKLLAEVIYWENWYMDKDKLAAYYTGAVVMNRVNSEVWPNTVHDVLYQKGQYSTTKKFFTEELPDEVYDMARDIIRNGTPDVPSNVVFQATFKQGKVWKTINGEQFCYGEA